MLNLIIKKNIVQLFLKLLIIDVVMTVVYLIFAYNSSDWTMYGEKSDDTLLKKILNRFYYSLNISTTLGLGPIGPNSVKIMIITILQIYISFLYMN